MHAETDRQRLIDNLLGGDGALARFVTERRDEGRSWRLISRDLWASTGEDVAYESLRSWFFTPVDGTKKAS